MVSITVVGLRRMGRWKASGYPTDLEQCVAAGVPLMKRDSAHPSILALMVDHPDDSVLFSTLKYMHPVHPQYLAMLDVDVVMDMLRRANGMNGVTVMTLVLDWYDGLGENQSSDDTWSGG